MAFNNLTLRASELLHVSLQTIDYTSYYKNLGRGAIHHFTRNFAFSDILHINLSLKNCYSQNNAYCFTSKILNKNTPATCHVSWVNSVALILKIWSRGTFLTREGNHYSREGIYNWKTYQINIGGYCRELRLKKKTTSKVQIHGFLPMGKVSDALQFKSNRYITRLQIVENNENALILHKVLGRAIP